MNDTLRYMHLDPIYRRHHQNDLSFRMIYAFTENFMLPLSHDEVVHGKRSLISQMPGDYWQQFANLRLLYGYQYAQPGKLMLFMGGELAQWHEWNHDEELDWALIGQHHHDGIRRFVSDLNKVYKSNPAFYEIDFHDEGFSWIQADDHENSVFAFCRFSKEKAQTIICVFNFTPIPRSGYTVGVPHAGKYKEIINSDANIYGGTNVGNAGVVTTKNEPMHGHAQSLDLTLPPLGLVFLRYEA